MSGVKLSIEADVSSVAAAMAALRREAQQTKAAFEGGAVSLDTDDALKHLQTLQSSAAAFKTALSQATQNRLVIDTGSATAALEEAQTVTEQVTEKIQAMGQAKLGLDTSEAKRSISELKKLLGSVRQPGKSDSGLLGEELEKAKALEQQLQSLKRTQSFLSRFAGRQITETEAQRFHEVFKRHQHKNVLLRGFEDANAWHAGISARFSKKSDAEAHRIERLYSMAQSAGISLPENNAATLRGSSTRYAGAQRFAGAMGGAFGGMMAGGGGLFGSVGGMAGTVLGMGAGSLFGGPLGAVVGAFAGNMLSSSFGGIGRQIDQAMTDALTEAIDASNLRRAMGDASSDFARLRDQVRYAADGMGVTYTESMRLAKQFAHTANLSGKDGADALSGELKHAYGFSRAYGMDPAQGVSFFAQMRLAKVTDDDKTSRNLGLAVAEAIGRGGITAKSDEVLQAISNFSQQATHVALSTPNVEAYASMLSTATSQNIAGLDVRGGASILDRADASMRQGGSYGDASKHVIMSALGKAHKEMSVFDVRTLMEQGIFGSAEKAFGKDSMSYKHAKALGDTAEMERLERLSSGPDAKKHNLARTLEELELQSMGNKKRYTESIANMFSISTDQARALDLMHKRDPGLGKLREKLKGLNIDLDKTDISSVAAIAELAQGGDKEFETYEKRLRKGDGLKALSAKELQMLDDAKATGDKDKLRDVLMTLMSSRGAQETEGSKALQVQADLKNTFQQFAGSMVPMTSAMKEGILALVQKLAPDSAYAKEISAKKQEALDTERDARKAVDIYGARVDSLKNQLEDPNLSAEGKQKIQQQLNAMEKVYNQAVTSAKAEALHNPYARQEYGNWAKELTSLTLSSQPSQPSGPSLPPDLPPIDTSLSRAINNSASFPPPGNTQIGQLTTPSQYDDIFKKIAAEEGVDWRDIKQLAVQESGLNPNAKNVNKNGTVDRGIMQLNSAYDKERGVTDPWDVEQNIRVGARVWADALRRSKGDKRGAFRRYNGSGAAAERYADRAMSLHNASRTRLAMLEAPYPQTRPNEFDAPIPNLKEEQEERRQRQIARQMANQKVSFEHNITLLDPAGRPMAAPVTTKTSWNSEPMPAGVPEWI